MPDTERYRRWVEMMTASDAVLLQLVALAVIAVLVWEAVRGLSEPWRGRLRLLYLAFGVGALMTALRGTVSTLILVVAAGVVGASAALARSLWVYLRRPEAGPVETKGQ